jgi:DNA-binding NarL/FixJ family response regulator
MPIQLEEVGGSVLAGLERALKAAPQLPSGTCRLRLDAVTEAPIPPAAVYVALCDLSADDSLAAVEALTNRLSAPLVLVVNATATARQMKAALRVGAAGLVREPDLDARLPGTVQAVRSGQLAVPLELARQIERPVLSRRQKQVMGLVVLGLSNGEIAAEMHLSEHTVKCHLSASFRKLGVRSRAEAVSMIVDPEEGFGTGILTIREGEGPAPAYDRAS